MKKDGTVSEVEEVSFSDGAEVAIQYCAETSQWQFTIPNAPKTNGRTVPSSSRSGQ